MSFQCHRCEGWLSETDNQYYTLVKSKCKVMCFRCLVKPYCMAENCTTKTENIMTCSSCGDKNVKLCMEHSHGKDNVCECICPDGKVCDIKVLCAVCRNAEKSAKKIPPPPPLPIYKDLYSERRKQERPKKIRGVPHEETNNLMPPQHGEKKSDDSNEWADYAPSKVVFDKYMMVANNAIRDSAHDKLNKPRKAEDVKPKTTIIRNLGNYCIDSYPYCVHECTLQFSDGTIQRKRLFKIEIREILSKMDMFEILQMSDAKFEWDHFFI